MISFEELEAWKSARELRLRITKLVKAFPSEEKYRLVDQLIRSSRSVTANIAEGFGRFHFQEDIQFCRQARGSLVESLDHLICANDEDFITSKKFVELKSDLFNCLKILNGYIAYLKKAKLKGDND